ncbi:cation diffusion facilitator family transporter [Caldisericum exile]|uniref:Cation efflux protein n=1 Tax=Caldisericum exile (strain DSM 21853 / NBRC 104410 / AZM16c01) TaxID=511051 RepID=A0A7U6GDK9_CALEA|nr:cation diffusion facilitator family transporter [Caldisericum exile]BAL80441.1 cation efflux protein [Caldisericum exile AZM16c01]
MEKEHNHNHEIESASGRVLVSIFMNIIITVLEVVFGILSRSLSLVSDSMHNLSDTISGILTLWTLRLSERKHNERFTFGYRRSQIISAFVNSSVLLVIAALLIREAILRFLTPEVINVSLMLPVAVVGLIANSISVILLHSHAHNLNIRSAYLHLLSDALSSVAVVLGAIFMWIFRIYWIDPLLTVLIAIYMGYEAFEIVKESTLILLETTPSTIDLKEVEKSVCDVPGVVNIHHVHIWRLDDETTLLEAHVNVLPNTSVEETKNIRLKIEEILRKDFGIAHTNIQFECNEHLEDKLIKDH